MKGRLIGQGRTAEIYAWGDEHVLKLFRADYSRAAVEYECRIACAVYQAGVDAPAVSETIVEVDGRAGLIYERVDGESMLSVIPQKPWLTLSLARQMAELHVRMHQKTSVDLPSQRDTFQRHIQAAPHLNDETKANVLRLLEKLPDGDVVCHGDFHPGNILLSRAGPRIIDWNNAFRGHPLADAARTSLVLQSGELPPGTGRLRKALDRSFRGLFRATYLRQYCRVSGSGQAQIEAWLPVVASARLIERVPGEAERLVEMVEKGSNKR